jgi:hypothetical protein
MPEAGCYQLKFRKKGENIVCLTAIDKNKVQEFKFE